MNTLTTTEKLFMLTATAPLLPVHEKVTVRKEFKKVEALPQLLIHLNSPSLKNIVLQEITHLNKGEALFVLEDVSSVSSQTDLAIWEQRKKRNEELKLIVSTL